MRSFVYRFNCLQIRSDGNDVKELTGMQREGDTIGKETHAGRQWREGDPVETDGQEGCPTAWKIDRMQLFIYFYAGRWGIGRICEIDGQGKLLTANEKRVRWAKLDGKENEGSTAEVFKEIVGQEEKFRWGFRMAWRWDGRELLDGWTVDGNPGRMKIRPTNSKISFNLTSDLYVQINQIMSRSAHRRDLRPDLAFGSQICLRKKISIWTCNLQHLVRSEDTHQETIKPSQLNYKFTTSLQFETLMVRSKSV